MHKSSSYLKTFMFQRESLKFLVTFQVPPPQKVAAAVNLLCTVTVYFHAWTSTYVSST